MKRKMTTRFIVEAGIIGAMYAVLGLLPYSSGQIQIRVAEVLTVLPAFTPAAIPGLFVGCILTNIVAGNGPVDIVFGSLATLLAAFLSYKMPKKYLVPMPPVVINAIVVGFILNYLYELPLLLSMGWVAIGQIIACYGMGYPFILILGRYRNRIF